MLEATYQIMDRMPNYKSERDRWSWGIGGLHYWKACQLDIDKEELLKNLDNKEVPLDMFKKSLSGDKTVLNNSAYNIIDNATTDDIRVSEKYNVVIIDGVNNMIKIDL